MLELNSAKVVREFGMVDYDLESVRSVCDYSENDIARLRTGYSWATHRYKMEGTLDPECPICSAKLTLEHILWQCKETEEKRQKSNMTKKVWEKGEEGAKMLVKYAKNIGLYCGLSYLVINTKTQIGTKKERPKNDNGNTANGQGKG
jgi:hypothetical protein